MQNRRAQKTPFSTAELFDFPRGDARSSGNHDFAGLCPEKGPYSDASKGDFRYKNPNEKNASGLGVEVGILGLNPPGVAKNQLFSACGDN